MISRWNPATGIENGTSSSMVVMAGKARTPKKGESVHIELNVIMTYCIWRGRSLICVLGRIGHSHQTGYTINGPVEVLSWAFSFTTDGLKAHSVNVEGLKGEETKRNVHGLTRSKSVRRLLSSNASRRVLT